MISKLIHDKIDQDTLKLDPDDNIDKNKKQN